MSEIRNRISSSSLESQIWQNTVCLYFPDYAATGFCIAANLILTAGHNIDNGKMPTIIHPSNGNCGNALKAFVSNEALDLALLQVNGNPFAAIPHLKFSGLRTSFPNNSIIIPDLSPGDTRWTLKREIGRLKETKPHFRTGIAVGYNQKDKFWFNAQVQPGFSGSPIVHATTGEVLSVVTSARFKGLWGLPVFLSRNSSRVYGPKSNDTLNFVETASVMIPKCPSGIWKLSQNTL